MSIPRISETTLFAWLVVQAHKRLSLWNSARIVQPFQVLFDQEPLTLESDDTLDQFTLQVEIYGQLNVDASNALLVCHALTGDAHLAGRHNSDDKKLGWWDELVGSKTAFNPDEHFIVCTNILGGCQGSSGPTSINPETGKPYHLNFPNITIGDTVAAQHRLMQALGITQWHSVVGGSMGGFQALEWSLRYPDALKKMVMIASGPSYSTQGIAFNAVGRHAIMHDPDWHSGDYAEHDTRPKKGLATARMLAHITYVSENALSEKFGRSLIREQDQRTTPLPPFEHIARHQRGEITKGRGSEFSSLDFQVESYLDYQGRQFVERFDANSYLYLTKMLDRFDVAERWGGGDLTTALKHIKAECFIISIDSDWLFSPKESLNISQALLKRETAHRYAMLESSLGHDAFLLEHEQLNRLLKPFLRLNPIDSADPPRPLMGRASEKRDDIPSILSMIEPHETVLDLGCGYGDFLTALIDIGHSARFLGIEQDSERAHASLRRNLPVIQGDMLDTLKTLADGSIDVAVLHLALQSLQDPVSVLQQMKRVAKRSIVGFPNFGYLPIRLQLLINGQMPNSNALPHKWYDTPNIHLFTLKDFNVLTHELGFSKSRQFFKTSRFSWKPYHKGLWGKNWRASHAIVELIH